MSAEGAGPVPGDHADRIRWNAKWAAGSAPSFTPHPLAVRALALGLPDGPVADLACGPSGTALLAAEQGRRVTAVDVSEVALGLLGDEARRRGLDGLVTLLHADLSAWAPGPRSYALVLCTGFWDAAVFATAVGAVGEPASLLPAGFALIGQSDLTGRERRQMLARRRAPEIACPPREATQGDGI